MLLSIMVDRTLLVLLAIILERSYVLAGYHSLTYEPSYNEELILQCLQMNEHDTSSFLKPVNHTQYYTPFGSLSSKSCLSESLRSSIVFCYNRANILMKSTLEVS